MFRNFILTLLLAFLCLSAEATTGDVNADGKVDVLDIISVIILIFDNGSATESDCNHDNKTDVIDVVCIINLITNTTPSNPEILIKVTWSNTALDFDAHITGPLSENSERFHVYFSEKGSLTVSPFVLLDSDEVSTAGPETVTIKEQLAGLYRFSIHDFTNRNATSSNAFIGSGIKVELLIAGNLSQTFNAPSEAGTLWTVFEMNGTTIDFVNAMSFEADENKISRMRKNLSGLAN